jgi:monoamine oxidase
MNEQRPMTHLNKSIVVIGAGFSGLRTAVELKRKGYRNITVLEASNRVGGRVHTLYNPRNKSFIEAGGELIGRSHTEWIEMARRYNLTLIPLDDEDDDDDDDDDDEVVFDDDSPILLKENTTFIHGRDASNLTRRTERAIEDLSSKARMLANWKEPWNESEEIKKLDYVSFGEIVDKSDYDDDVKALIYLYFERDNVAPLHEQSWLGLMCQMAAGGYERFWDDAENFICKEGNQSLAECMAKEEGINVRLNTPVVSIRKEEDGITITTTGVGGIIECDFVVLSTPPSTWHNISFHPPLPFDQFRMPMGKAMKCLIERRSPSSSSLPSDPFKHCHSISFGEGWTHDVIGKSEENPLHYDPFSPPCWIRDEFDLSIYNNHGIVKKSGDSLHYTIFSGGNTVCDAYGMDGAHADVRYVKELSTVLNADKMDEKKEGEISNHRNDCNYISSSIMGCSIIDWSQKEFTQSAYSYAGLGKMTTTMPLLNSVHKANSLAITGEACNPNMGYMNSALEHGLWTAERVDAYLSQMTVV